MMERLSCSGLSQVMNCGHMIMNLHASVEAWSGTHVITQDQKFKSVSLVSKMTILF